MRAHSKKKEGIMKMKVTAAVLLLVVATSATGCGGIASGAVAGLVGWGAKQLRTNSTSNNEDKDKKGNAKKKEAKQGTTSE